MVASLKGSNYYSSLLSQFCQDYKANAKESTMMSNSLSFITFQSILVNRDLSKSCKVLFRLAGIWQNCFRTISSKLIRIWFENSPPHKSKLVTSVMLWRYGCDASVLLWIKFHWCQFCLVSVRFRCHLCGQVGARWRRLCDVWIGKKVRVTPILRWCYSVLWYAKSNLLLGVMWC